MKTAVLIGELIFFILATLLMGYMCLNVIISDIKSRKQRKQLDKSIGEFCEKLSNAIITAESVEEPKKENKKSEIKKTKVDYENMPIVELYKVARDLKVKGYYKLHKKELIDKANEFLRNVNEPISGELMIDAIKGDIESFDRVSEEAAIAIRTLEWVKSIEDTDIETQPDSEEN